MQQLGNIKFITNAHLKLETTSSGSCDCFMATKLAYELHEIFLCMDVLAFIEIVMVFMCGMHGTGSLILVSTDFHIFLEINCYSF